MGTHGAGAVDRHGGEPVDGAPTPTVVRGEHFEAFYRREYRLVVALTYSLSGSRTAAEDIAQDALTHAYRDWDRISALEFPAAYVRRIAANMAVSRTRRLVAEAKAVLRVSHRRHLPAELEPEDADFWAAVRSLPPQQAKATALRYAYGCSVEEVAAALGCSTGTAKAHLHRARRSLAQRLQLDPAPQSSIDEAAS